MRPKTADRVTPLARLGLPEHGEVERRSAELLSGFKFVGSKGIEPDVPTDSSYTYSITFRHKSFINSWLVRDRLIKLFRERGLTTTTNLRDASSHVRVDSGWFNGRITIAVAGDTHLREGIVMIKRILSGEPVDKRVERFEFSRTTTTTPLTGFTAFLRKQLDESTARALARRRG